ncbi:MAG: flippase [Verrucomicrobia bacterium]|nr:flippase [Verrucomicrobiota bacterium]
MEPIKQSQRIFKNVLAGGIAVGVGGILLLIALVFVARSVSVSDFGLYSFILAFAAFVQLLADSGLSNILVRELATRPEKMSEILGAALSLIWVLSIAGELLILAIVPFLNLSLEVKILIVAMGAATLTILHCSGYGAALRSQEDNELHALGYLVHKGLFLAIIVVGLKMGLALVAVVLAHIIPNILLCCYYRWMVIRLYGRPKIRIDFSKWRYLLTHSIPVGGATLIRLLAQQVDVMILSWLTDLRTVGLFSGPYRISMAIRFIPETMALPLYPMYSRLAIDPEKKQALHSAYERSLKFFLIVGFPVATLFLIFAGKLITLLLGDKYQVALPAMQLLGVAFLPFFASSPFPFLFTALNRQRFLMLSALCSLGLRVALNFLLIPIYGYLGPCIAFFASETAMFSICAGKLSRIGFPLGLVGVAWRPLLASACIGGGLYFIKGASLFWVIPATFAALAIYLLILFLLRAFTDSDLRLVREGLGFFKPFLARWTSHAVAMK